VIEKFQDRQQAGQLLAMKLSGLANRSDVIVLGLPRGGVPLACEIARSLHVELDVFLVRKVGVPGYEELALGAIASGGVEIIDPDVAEEFCLTPGEIESLVIAAQQELRRRETVFRGSRPMPDLRGRTVVLVDDGIATGSTMRAAIEGVKRLKVARVIVAVGAMPLSTSMRLRPEVDEVVCPLTPRDFRAVGLFYEEFPQLSDDDVGTLLENAWQTGARKAALA
jgi:putative phosphoribosyl transferase